MIGPPYPDRENPPGQADVRYRTGDWSIFRARMVNALSDIEVPSGARPLRDLTTRDPSDPTIALIDAASCTLDVLTFYNERTINEGYLATAQERMSLAMIARMIGYEPAPGLAASGYLAFTTSALATGPTEVPAGTAVMAMPEGSDPPPIVETIEAVTALPEWNAIPVLRRQPTPDVLNGDEDVWVDGLETRAQEGDGVLLVGQHRTQREGSERWDFRRLTEVEDDAEHGETRLVFDRPLGDAHTDPPRRPTKVMIFRNRASLFGFNAPDWAAQSNQTQLVAWGRANRSFSDLPARDDPDDDRTRLLRRTPPVTEWPAFALAEDPAVKVDSIDLDREYPGIVAGSWVVLADAYNVEAFEVVRASQRARVDFGLTGKVTRLKLRGENLSRFNRRATTVYCEPDTFTHVGPPDTSEVTGATVRLAGDHRGLLNGLVAFYGPLSDSDTPVGEVVRVTAAQYPTDGETVVTIDPPLSQNYVRTEVLLNANIALATHGAAATPETLENGNAAEAFQTVVLKGRPLTHIADANASTGAASTLSVRVNGVAWSEVPFLWGQEPDARVYRLRHSSDGTTLVEFGDGKTGARLPTGAGNIVATYRTGLGLAGEVEAGRASLLAKRPEGIESAFNPANFSGGDDPEGSQSIRLNAPQTVLTLDRLVALKDYEDFASGFAGIGKALAASLTEGQRRMVHLTIASASGEPLGPTDPLRLSLRQAIATRQDPVHQVSVDTFTPRTFGVSAAVAVEPTRIADEVYEAVRVALIDAFAFQTQRFGEGVTPSEVVAVFHTVPGVIAVDLEKIWRTDDATIAAPPAVVLPAMPPLSVDGVRQTAELLTASTDPAHILLEAMPI